MTTALVMSPHVALAIKSLKLEGSSLAKRNEEIAAFFVANRQRVFEELSVIILSHVKNED